MRAPALSCVYFLPIRVSASLALSRNPIFGQDIFMSLHERVLCIVHTAWHTQIPFQTHVKSRGSISHAWTFLLHWDIRNFVTLSMRQHFILFMEVRMQIGPLKNCISRVWKDPVNSAGFVKGKKASYFQKENTSVFAKEITSSEPISTGKTRGSLRSKEIWLYRTHAAKKLPKNSQCFCSLRKFWSALLSPILCRRRSAFYHNTRSLYKEWTSTPLSSSLGWVH